MSINQAAHSGRLYSSSSLDLWHSSTSPRAGPSSSISFLYLVVSRRSYLGHHLPLLYLFLKSMENPGSLSRGTPLPRHLWCLELLGGVNPRPFSAHCTVLYNISSIGGTPSNPSRVVTAFFQTYLALAVVVLFYTVGDAWEKTILRRAHQIHLDVSRFLNIHSA